MSVKGEFLRISAEVVSCLRDGPEPARSLAERVQTIRGGANRDLAGAADALLDAWTPDDPTLREGLADDARARFDDASERLLAVARIITGRPAP